MIVFELECAAHRHRFEGWFGSSEEFAAQQARGLVTCPQCGSADVVKAPMAPAVPRKGNQREPARPTARPTAGPTATGAALPGEAREVMEKLAALQAEALRDSRYVGESFAAVSRAMHYGEQDTATIHGQASLAEAKELLEEGIALMPLPFPVAPPDKLN